MTRHLRPAALLCSIAFTLFSGVQAQARPLQVVASFSIIADMARHVGGDRIQLTTLVGPDSDIHAYEPRPSDAMSLARADVVLVNGLHLEGFLPRLVRASGSRAPVVELSRGTELLESAEEEDGHGHAHHHHGKYDPHAWQSVRNAQVYVKNIQQALCAADRQGCDTYRANAQAYLGELRALDGEIATMMRAIPAGKRRIITSHDGFGHFGHAYGITFLGAEGLSTQSEPSAAGIAALISQAKEQKVAAIFAENITDTRLIQRIAAETGLRVQGTLYSDALSGAGGPASTYIDMMRHNANAIRQAVGAAGHSVTEAAPAVGYANLSHFSKSFRDAHGMPPSQWGRRAEA